MELLIVLVISIVVVYLYKTIIRPLTCFGKSEREFILDSERRKRENYKVRRIY